MPQNLVIEIIGLVAAVLSTLSFVPQAVLVIRTKRTAGISLAMYSMFTIGLSAWLVYGILLMAWPLIIANSITLVLAIIIWWTTFINRRKKHS